MRPARFTGVARRAANILRRAGVLAGQTLQHEVRPRRDEAVFDHDFVMPMVAKVVRVIERSRPAAERGLEHAVQLEQRAGRIRRWPITSDLRSYLRGFRDQVQKRRAASTRPVLATNIEPSLTVIFRSSDVPPAFSSRLI